MAVRIGYVVPTDSPNSPDITDIDIMRGKNIHMLGVETM